MSVKSPGQNLPPPRVNAGSGRGAVIFLAQAQRRMSTSDKLSDALPGVVDLTFATGIAACPPSERQIQNHTGIRYLPVSLQF